ncbi:Benzylsuccinate synthase activating enzyme [Limihaloglobus sulfuriphilus]|uniref:Benzylsuccinate synthase activating enzyme n=1 Tax=Limihaloglobus sulfuriphilus TaxID=1851148 RepID=A0A1Q2MH16_9BACT|nr:glycyl-radical enzyme activating protein [Limihaloglobus sulfuriphilus]AQQ71944.1 Benzylsuccinate synthase activating enzyme [Limihaloglobus sulfuriphilus]
MSVKQTQRLKQGINSVTGGIYKIQRFCINDGPGLRTTVFFKGCQLRCKWCHNPETIPARRTFLLNHDTCTLCGRCVTVCPVNAHKIEAGTHTVDRNSCTFCGKCESICPVDAIEIAGETMSVSDVIEIIRKDQIYYAESGGGVTLSGGEPMMQPDFAGALIQECKEAGYSVYVDTNGAASPGVYNSVVKDADGILFDIKLINSRKHLEYTGMANEQILKNFRNSCPMDKDLIVRYVVIPGINDGAGDLTELCDFLEKCGFDGELELLAYHRLGLRKYASMGLDYELSAIEPPSQERMNEIQSYLRSNNLQAVYRK